MRNHKLLPESSIVRMLAAKTANARSTTYPKKRYEKGAAQPSDKSLLGYYYTCDKGYANGARTNGQNTRFASSVEKFWTLLVSCSKTVSVAASRSDG